MKFLFVVVMIGFIAEASRSEIICGRVVKLSSEPAFGVNGDQGHPSKIYLETYGSDPSLSKPIQIRLMNPPILRSPLRGSRAEFAKEAMRTGRLYCSNTYYADSKDISFLLEDPWMPPKEVTLEMLKGGRYWGENGQIYSSPNDWSWTADGGGQSTK